MYTKEELEKLPIPELMEIASELGIKVSQNDELESVVYAILDKAAENSAAGAGKYQYVLAFEFISLFLLACIIGGLVVARKEKKEE